jgi:hypothetical protein
MLQYLITCGGGDLNHSVLSTQSVEMFKIKQNLSFQKCNTLCVNISVVLSLIELNLGVDYRNA